jgi:hypothetical protein
MGGKMKNEKEAETHAPEMQPHRVRLPGFLLEEEIGLGDLIKKTTYAMGIKQCHGCEMRAIALNRWMTFTR